ncbi:hypothetical protein HUU40_27145 [candidate division KSB1 bacterium]|nr:hypothetical protein [candidate division KSB1 bacterium]
MPKRKSLPNFGSYKAASEWLDTHSTAELYAKPVKFSVSPNLQVLVVDAQGHPIESVSLKKQMSQQIRRIAAAGKDTRAVAFIELTTKKPRDHS